MSLQLITHSVLQRRQFRSVRQRLQGSEITLFSAHDYRPNTSIPIVTSRVHHLSLSIGKTLLRMFLSGIILGSIITLGSIVIPEVYARAFPENTEDVVAHYQAQETPVAVAIPEYTPEFDATLPLGSWIAIPSIGVSTEVQATSEPNEALDTGAWMAPDFGRPGETADPIIIAAHRFGWQSWWQTDYWRQNSFYLLTDTKPGDRVEIIYEQRKWVYEIYAGEEGTEISDYDADLILYTCKFLNSPERYFRYARLVTE